MHDDAITPVKENDAKIKYMIYNALFCDRRGYLSFQKRH